MKKLSVFALNILICFLLTAQLPQLSLVQLATSYASPVDIKTCGDQRLFIVEQKGIIRILYKDGTKQSTPFLDINARVNNYNDEQGLLGLAFSPNFKQDGYFYVHYTSGADNNTVDSIRVSRFRVMATDSTQADPNSEQVLISFHDLEWNHNGGNLMFGPDGYLYDSQGDGGSGGDPDASHGTGGNGQNKNVWFGKMLRIDVTGQTTYAVPPTNPFVGVPNTKPEIWAYGLRNPWRCSFDRLTGDMWIGDVGQDNYEEIDFQAAGSVGGENYGWRCREGLHVCPNCNTSGCPSIGFVDPIRELPQAGGASCSILGGYVYRGSQYSKLFGLYLHSDYCSGIFWSITRTGPTTFVVDSLKKFTSYQYTSFGQDNLGELYVAYRGSASGSTGRIYRITETSNCNPVAFISFKDSVEGCSSVTLSALKGDTLSYQWYNSAGLINGETSHQFTTQQTGWYKVKVSKQQLGCEAMSDSVYVAVSDTTAITGNSTDTTVCITEPNFIITGYASPVGGDFTGNGVTGSSFSPLTAGTGASQIIYSYTNLTGCESRYSFNLHVEDITTLSKNISDSIFCSNESPVSLISYVSPSGGVFSGSGVSNDNFDPASAPLGTSTIVYEYTNVSGCVSSDSFQLEVSICSSIQESGESISFNIFPNPAKGKLNLEVNVNQIQQAELSITDAVGKICYRKNQMLDPNKPVVSLELPQLAKGIYSFQLKGEKGKAVKSLVIE